MSGCGYMYVSVGAGGGHKGALDFPWSWSWSCDFNRYILRVDSRGRPKILIAALQLPLPFPNLSRLECCLHFSIIHKAVAAVDVTEVSCIVSLTSYIK